MMQSYYGANQARVKLDDYICDLNLEIEDGGYSCTPMSKDGFSYMWAGVKGTYGIRSGKACFEVKIVDYCEVTHKDPTDTHVARVGWSTDSATLQLGEDKNSFGFGGTGKKSVNRKFLNYGRRYEKGDVVGCYLAMENGWVDISYSVNGRYCGSAFKIRWMTDEALFPHVLTKNCKLSVNFGQAAHPYFSLQPGYKLIDHFPTDFKIPAVRPPLFQRDCEIIMMVGLPGVGKSTWAMNYAKIHPSKKYVVLGTDSIIDKMRVMGLPRKNNFTGRWDMLIKQASDCFNTLLRKASMLPRNLILDQTNVYATARRRKVKQYREKGYTVNAMVLVPHDEDMVRRSEKRTQEEGKEVPEAAVLDMKANFSLPDEREQLFDEITFLELQRPEAQALVEQYNREAMAKGHRSNQQRGSAGGNLNQVQRNQQERGTMQGSFASQDKYGVTDRSYGQQLGSGDAFRSGMKRPDPEVSGPPEKYRRAEMENLGRNQEQNFADRAQHASYNNEWQQSRPQQPQSFYSAQAAQQWGDQRSHQDVDRKPFPPTDPDRPYRDENKPQQYGGFPGGRQEASWNQQPSYYDDRKSYQEPPTSAVKSEPAHDDAYPGAGQVYDQWQRSITESRSNQSYSQAPDVKPATNQMGYSSQYDQGARSQNSQMQHSTGGHHGFSERPPVERDDVRQSSYGQNASYSQQGSRDMSASSVSRSTASDYADQRQPLQQGSRYERTPYQQSEFQQSQYQQSQYQQENYRQGQHQHGQYEQDQYQQQNQHGYSRPPAAQDNRKASTSQGWHEPQRAQHHEQASYGQQSRSSYGQGYDDNSGYNARLQTDVKQESFADGSSGSYYGGSQTQNVKNEPARDQGFGNWDGYGRGSNYESQMDRNRSQDMSQNFSQTSYSDYSRQTAPDNRRADQKPLADTYQRPVAPGNTTSQSTAQIRADHAVEDMDLDSDYLTDSASFRPSPRRGGDGSFQQSGNEQYYPRQYGLHDDDMKQLQYFDQQHGRAESYARNTNNRMPREKGNPPRLDSRQEQLEPGRFGSSRSYGYNASESAATQRGSSLQGASGRDDFGYGGPPRDTRGRGGPSHGGPQDAYGQGDPPRNISSRGAPPHNVPGRGSPPRDVHGRGGTPRDIPGRGDTPRDIPGRGDTPRDIPGRGGTTRDIPGRGGTTRDIPGRGDAPRDIPGRGDAPRDIPGRGDAPRDIPGRGDPPRDIPGRGAPPREGRSRDSFGRGCSGHDDLVRDGSGDRRRDHASDRRDSRSTRDDSRRDDHRDSRPRRDGSWDRDSHSRRSDSRSRRDDSRSKRSDREESRQSNRDESRRSGRDDSRQGSDPSRKRDEGKSRSDSKNRDTSTRRDDSRPSGRRSDAATPKSTDKPTDSPASNRKEDSRPADNSASTKAKAPLVSKPPDVSTTPTPQGSKPQVKVNEEKPATQPPSDKPPAPSESTRPAADTKVIPPKPRGTVRPDGSPLVQQVTPKPQSASPANAQPKPAHKAGAFSNSAAPRPRAPIPDARPRPPRPPAVSAGAPDPRPHGLLPLPNSRPPRPVRPANAREAGKIRAGETDAHTLSKLASVDFDTLKASLAKIRHSESLMQKKVVNEEGDEAWGENQEEFPTPHMRPGPRPGMRPRGPLLRRPGRGMIRGVRPLLPAPRQDLIEEDFESFERPARRPLLETPGIAEEITKEMIFEEALVQALRDPFLDEAHVRPRPRVPRPGFRGGVHRPPLRPRIPSGGMERGLRMRGPPPRGPRPGMRMASRGALLRGPRSRMGPRYGAM